MNGVCELVFFVSDVRADELTLVFFPHFLGAKNIKKIIINSAILCVCVCVCVCSSSRSSSSSSSSSVFIAF